MKLRNKKTGEIGTLSAGAGTKYMILDENGVALSGYMYLKDLCLEWYDYEEPTTYYYISDFGAIREGDVGKFVEDEIVRKEIGNYFETKEQAEKAVEKLKAWKRLKDRGFRFKNFTRKFDGFKRVDENVFITAELDDEGIIGMIYDLNICFGGEE